jgi:hypothetical protein
MGLSWIDLLEQLPWLCIQLVRGINVEVFIASCRVDTTFDPNVTIKVHGWDESRPAFQHPEQPDPHILETKYIC